jgi:hypothetical protein
VSELQDNEPSNPATSTARDHFVYHLFNAESDLLYVGCSRRVQKRLEEHRQSARRAMVNEIHHIKLKGPYTRDVARAIERADIRGPVEPLYGWTPQRHREQRARSRWINDRLAGLIAGGTEVGAAVSQAVKDADEWFPDPNEYEHRYNERVSA